MSHTPTPWEAFPLLKPQWGVKAGDYFSILTTNGGNDEANAKHIAHCVNNHGFRYEGPMYSAELETARAALKAVKGE